MTSCMHMTSFSDVICMRYVI